MSRLEALAGNSSNAVPAVRAAARGYRSSEASARDFISTVWNVLDHNLDSTASIVNAFVDLLDEEEKNSVDELDDNPTPDNADAGELVLHALSASSLFAGDTSLLHR